MEQASEAWHTEGHHPIAAIGFVSARGRGKV